MKLAMHDDGKDRGGGRFDGSSGRLLVSPVCGRASNSVGRQCLGGSFAGGKRWKPAEALLLVRLALYGVR